MQLKQCKKCNLSLPITSFGNDKKSKDKLKYMCRNCENIKQKLWRDQNKDKVAERFKTWYDKTIVPNRKHVQQKELLEQGLKKCSACKQVKKLDDFYKDTRKSRPNKDGHLASCISCTLKRTSEWSSKNPHSARAKTKRWKQRRIENLLSARMSNAIYYALNRNKKSKWLTYVPYTISQLKNHLESLFTEGMNWDVFATGQIHIDHVKPKSWFHYSSPQDEGFKQCWALSNLQPMWATENCSKNNRYAGKHKKENSDNSQCIRDEQSRAPI